jgi:excinuclease ABC subunit C
MQQPVHPRPDFPVSPGVYTWRLDGEPIYIGKAKNLRNRLASYYRSNLDPKTKVMVSLAQTIEWIELESEEQALLLEAQLIKRHRPYFNVRLKDDRAYPYIALTDGRYPRMFVEHRTSANPGWRYWGPYTDSREVKEAVEAMKALFLNPLWKGELHRKKDPPVSVREWKTAIDKMVAIIEGDRTWEAEALERMWAASREQNYKFAARLRDWIEAVRLLRPRRALNEADSFDILGWAQSEDGGNLQIMQLRSGHLVGRRSYTTETGSAVAAVLDAYRLEPPPARLYMDPLPADSHLVERGLGRPLMRARGGKLGYARTARLNAENMLRYVTEHERTMSPASKLKDLERALMLKSLHRIECFDISNLGDRHPVGAMAVMIDGVSVRRLYRRWKMEAAGQDDFEMIGQLIAMRIAAIGKEEKRLADRPDLIVIDGGPGQLAQATRALKEAGVSIPVIALAKRLEQVYIPGHASALDLRKDSPGSLLLQQLRDEVHRTAVGRHRQLRDEAALHGDMLSDVRGLGPTRRQKLMDHFGELEHVLAASQDELEQVLGPKVAESVYRQLQR